MSSAIGFGIRAVEQSLVLLGIAWLLAMMTAMRHEEMVKSVGLVYKERNFRWS